jgi:antitoxin ParD1/3/4
MAQDTSIGRDAQSTGPLSRQVACGRDPSASEALRAALIEGEASGDAAPSDVDAFIADTRA